jgi:hypothetical protein
VLGFRYNQLLARRGEYSHRIVYGIDYRAYLNNCTLGNFGAVGCGPAAVNVTVMPINFAYSGNWEKPGRITDFYVGLSQNIPGATHGRENDFNAVRPSPNAGKGASSYYSMLRFGASTLNAFENNWQVRAAFNAQYTADSLVPGEQYGITGATSVRGFLEREIIRDNGLVANLEFYSPNIVGKLFPSEGNLRTLLFYDMAAGSNNPLSGEARQQVSISSIGTGLRWKFQRSFNLSIDLARVVKPGGNNKTGDMHGHFSVYFGF